jgi:segregation and condensation protein A
MATWLTYLKSKLLLPDDEKDDFKVLEVAEKLKLQLKKLELIRLMSDLLLKKNRLGLDVFLRGKPDGIRSIHSPKYAVSLYEILKAYSNHRMRKDFLRVNIPRLPVLTTEEGIKRIKVFFGNLNDWRKISELVPKEFMTKNFIKTGLAGIFSASLELSKEGKINIMQKKLFDYVLIKERKT